MSSSRVARSWERSPVARRAAWAGSQPEMLVGQVHQFVVERAGLLQVAGAEVGYQWPELEQRIEQRIWKHSHCFRRGPRVVLTRRSGLGKYALMAQKVSVEFLDDLDGKLAVETITFGLDGRDYEIDLSAKNAKALRAALEAWISAGRRVGGRRARATTLVETGVDNQAVRAWAASNGIELSARGRISKDVIDQYHAAGH